MTFYLEEPNKTRMVVDGMKAMHAKAKAGEGRQRACVTGVPLSCYRCASGNVLWRANGYTYSRKDLETLLIKRAHQGLE